VPVSRGDCVRCGFDTAVVRDVDDLSDTLCHYTTADAAFRHIIPRGQLRMSPYARMRDPLENRELPFSAGAWDSDATGEVLEDEDVDEALSDAAEEDAVFAEVTAGIKRLRDATRLLSFTIDAKEGYTERDLPFMRAWARARIWEQYASNHAGVCIAFDRERALGHVTAHLHTLGMPTAGAVTYTPRGFRDTQASELQPDPFHAGDELHQDIASFVVEHEHDLFFVKTLDWQSEHEFRVTLMTNVEGDAEYVYVPFGDAQSVRAVILGEQFPDWQIPAAKWACEQVGVTLLALHWIHGLPWPLPATGGRP
jgi:Protein of unknown function (DUF2971)